MNSYEDCRFCGKPTKSHHAGQTYICHTCYAEQPDLSRGLLEDAREREQRETEEDEIMDQLDTFETDDAFYADMTPLHKNLYENREEIIESVADPENLIDDLYTHISRSEMRDLVYSLGEMFVLGSTLAENEGTEEDTAGLPPRMLEYILGLVSAARNSQINTSSDVRDDEADIIGSITDTSKELMQAIPFSRMSDPDSLSEEEQYEKYLELQLLSRELTAGRFVYPGQYFEAAERAYGPHDDMLESMLGFRINDAIDFTTKLAEVFGDRFEESIQQFMRVTRTAKVAEGRFLNILSQNPELDIADYTNSAELKSERKALHEELQIYHEKRRATWISHDELLNLFPDRQDRFEDYLERMSIEVGSADSDEFRYPYQHNPVHAAPILKYNDEYIVPHFKLFFRTLAQTFYYDLINNPDYGSSGEHGGEFGRIWGEYLEEWAFELIEELSTNGNVILNPKYDIDGSEFESDVVFVQDGYCFVIECKAQKLTLRTRQGDYAPIENDVVDGIGEGYQQADRLIRKIQEEEVTEFRSGGEIYEVNGDEIKEYVPIVVLGEQYDSVATIEYPRIADIEDNIPYVVSIYDLEVLCECTTFQEFTEYIAIRIMLTQDQKLHSPDELDYLGAYLDNGLEIVEMFEDYTVRSTDFSHIVSKELGEGFYPEFVKGGEIGY